MPGSLVVALLRLLLRGHYCSFGRCCRGLCRCGLRSHGLRTQCCHLVLEHVSKGRPIPQLGDAQVGVGDYLRSPGANRLDTNQALELVRQRRKKRRFALR